MTDEPTGADPGYQPVPAERYARRAVRQAPLTWGQQYFWFDHHTLSRQHRRTLILLGERELPGGWTGTELRHAVDAVVARHEATRSRFCVAEDGTPVQVVLPVEPVPVRSHPDTDRAGARARLAGWDVDIGTDAPLRVTALTDPTGTATAVLVAVHHLAADARSVENLMDAILAARPSSVDSQPAVGPQPVPAAVQPAAVQPAEQVAAEADRSGARTARRALTYWDQLYARIPALPFPYGPPPRAGQGYHLGTLRSGPVAAAARTLAQRHNVNPGTVYLAAFAAATARLTGLDCCPVTLAAANRMSGTQTAIGCFFQPVLLCLAVVPGESFPELLTRAAASTMSAQLNARYPFFPRREAQARHEHRRGVALRLPPEFNLIEHPGEPAEPTTDTTLAWSVEWHDGDLGDLRLWLHTHPERTDVVLLVRDTLMDQRQGSELLTGMRRILEAAATGVPAPEWWPPRAEPPRPGWAEVDHCLVDLAATAELVRSVPGVRAATVVLSADPTGPQLTAYLHHADRSATPAAIRRAVLDRIGVGRPVIAPHRIVLCAGTPADPADPAAWADQPVLARGDGTGPDPGTPAGPALRALCQAVGRYHPALRWTAASVYAPAGGQAAVLPAVLAELARLGYAGITAHDLIGPASFGALAARLRPVAVPAGVGAGGPWPQTHSATPQESR